VVQDGAGRGQDGVTRHNATTRIENYPNLTAVRVEGVTSSNSLLRTTFAGGCAGFSAGADKSTVGWIRRSVSIETEAVD